MIFPFIGTTVILGMITGFADLNKRGFFGTLGGQIVHGALSIACLVLVGVAFWLFGWKIGLLDFFLSGNPYYYLLFLIAAGGLLLQFPRREHVVNASFKKAVL